MGTKREYRNIQTEVRATDGSRRMEGYAVVFGQRSVLLRDWNGGEPVLEQIEPSAITDELLRNSDIIATINHDEDKMLARSCNGKGSLSLKRDEHGLLVSWDCAPTMYGDFAYESAKRGDFGGMSFGMELDPKTDVSYTREKDEDGNDIVVRHINAIRGLFDVSVVTHPAYPETVIQARSAEVGAELRDAFGESSGKVREERNAEMLRDWDKIEQAKRQN